MTELEASLISALQTYDAAARKFLAKVESGQARSVTTYEELKKALEKSEGVQSGKVTFL